MKTLYIERSTGGVRDGGWVEELDLDGVTRIVVGTGPGSFAGIRSAIAFAAGYSLGRKCEVLGLPSPCAVAARYFMRQGSSADGAGKGLAVVGDARRGKFWVALFMGLAMSRDVFQTDAEGLAAAVPDDCAVATPDAHRIEGLLAERFGARYAGGIAPDEDGLRAFAEANPAMLKPEPLPIYLNPAVRE